MRWTCLFLSIALVACATPGRLTPQMRTVVTCVYDSVRAHPGVLSTEVYVTGYQREDYLVKFKFRGKAGVVLTGGLGLYSGPNDDGTYAYTNEPPRGQPDNNGMEEMDFLGDIWDQEMMEKCRLMPTLMDEYVLPGTPPPPPRERVDMGE